MPTYILNGAFRRKTLTVDYLDASGNHVTGYPKTYNILSLFVNPATGMTFPLITEVQFAQMSDADYAARLAAFYNYVEAANTGLDHTQHIVAGYGPTGSSPLCEAGTVVLPTD